eukprot:TRINITY_DN14108_c0_g1_i1.p1 TRINITY_DN14108_c0_g1~~TRINITY_DN14108_c0_g1_i1.p1  ORF type:complete len:559 (+),score=73.65 TRINITY_DN14108_c0_g1_i1:46-1722(+)
MHTSLQEIDILLSLAAPLQHLVNEVVFIGKKKQGRPFFGNAPPDGLVEFVAQTIVPTGPTYHVTFWNPSRPEVMGNGMAWPVAFLRASPEDSADPITGVFAFAGHTFCSDTLVKVTYTDDIHHTALSDSSRPATILFKTTVEHPAHSDLSLLTVSIDGTFGEQPRKAVQMQELPEVVRNRLERDVAIDVAGLATLPCVAGASKNKFYDVYDLLNPYWEFTQASRRKALFALRNSVDFGRTCWIWGELRSTFGRHCQRLQAIRCAILDRLSQPDELSGHSSFAEADDAFIHLHTVLCNMSAEANEVIGADFARTRVLDRELVPKVKRKLTELIRVDEENKSCSGTAVGLMTIAAGCSGARICISRSYLDTLRAYEPVPTPLQPRALTHPFSQAREKAAELFKQEAWGEAAQLYTDLIESSAGEERLIMHSNRAQTFIQLGEWCFALHDALASLKGPISNQGILSKCWHRRARAEIGLGDYNAAECTLERLPENSSKATLRALIPAARPRHQVQLDDMLCIGHLWGVEENTNVAIFQLLTPEVHTIIQEAVGKLARINPV